MQYNDTFNYKVKNNVNGVVENFTARLKVLANRNDITVKEFQSYDANDMATIAQSEAFEGSEDIQNVASMSGYLLKGEEDNRQMFLTLTVFKDASVGIKTTEVDGSFETQLTNITADVYDGMGDAGIAVVGGATAVMSLIAGSVVILPAALPVLGVAALFKAVSVLFKRSTNDILPKTREIVAQSTREIFALNSVPSFIAKLKPVNVVVVNGSGVVAATDFITTNFDVTDVPSTLEVISESGAVIKNLQFIHNANWMNEATNGVDTAIANAKTVTNMYNPFESLNKVFADNGLTDVIEKADSTKVAISGVTQVLGIDAGTDSEFAFDVVDNDLPFLVIGSLDKNMGNISITKSQVLKKVVDSLKQQGREFSVLLVTDEYSQMSMDIFKEARNFLYDEILEKDQDENGVANLATGVVVMDHSGSDLDTYFKMHEALKGVDVLY